MRAAPPVIGGRPRPRWALKMLVMYKPTNVSATVLIGLVCAASGCTAERTESPETEAAAMEENTTSGEPPERIRAWMDRLDVEHAYDPETGFIVAREVIGLPPVIVSGPPAEEAVTEDGLVVVFATADRCAPCQQYKKSALNDPRVIDALGREGLVVTHVEVDREPETAESVLGSLAIPMTYAFRGGERVAERAGSGRPKSCWRGSPSNPPADAQYRFDLSVATW